MEQLKHIVAQYAYTDPDLGPTMPMSSRNRPKRETEVLDGGSVFWIIKRQIVARASILAIREEKRFDGKKGCQICVKPDVIPTVPAPKRGFQGWRYLRPEDAPKDLSMGDTHDGTGSPELAAELQVLGLL